jgi:hypothetical protein
MPQKATEAMDKTDLDLSFPLWCIVCKRRDSLEVNQISKAFGGVDEFVVGPSAIGWKLEFLRSRLQGMVVIAAWCPECHAERMQLPGKTE